MEKDSKYLLVNKFFTDCKQLLQVKSGNISESLLNEIRQILYFLYRAEEITFKLYNNIMN